MSSCNAINGGEHSLTMNEVISVKGTTDLIAGLTELLKILSKFFKKTTTIIDKNSHFKNI